MICLQCDRRNETDASFCAGCGTPLAFACTSCGRVSEPDARFCSGCGQRLGSPEPETGDAAPSVVSAASPTDAPADHDAATLAMPPLSERAAPVETPRGERYRIERLLGRGGSKRVYLARDTRLDRDVALALIETGELDEAGRARLLRETQAMGQLGDHPNIVTVLDVIEEPDRVFLVSQYMAGGDLARRLASSSDRRLAPAEAVAVAIAVCSALEHAHARGLVHRDVKPGNIWLTAAGEARLGDFGLAYAVDRTRLTQERLVMGTAAYMAPEQALGQAPDRRSDLYALGATLYEMVTGRPPFVGDDAVAVISQHINTPPVAPGLSTRDLPRDLEALILELLAKDPEARPADAPTVLARLEQIGRASSSEAATLAGPATAAAGNPLDRLAGGVFVGRETEVERGRALFEEALSGRTGWLLVMGEPGIGKTRVCEELTTYARMRGSRALWGRCHEGEGAPPYWPWIQVVRSWVEGREPEALERDLGFGAADVADMVSEIRQVLPDLPAAPRLDAEQARFRLFDGIVGFLRNVAQETPLLLVLDDLHWADKPSLLLLEFLARELGSARVMVVATYRDVELRRRHPLAETLAELARLGIRERVQLRGIDRDQVARFIEQSAAVEPPPSLVEAIHRETEGNPFFVHEVVRLLVADGRLAAGELAGKEASGSGAWSLEIPQGVREVIGRRLNRLSDDCNELLLAAAVVGREFDAAVVERVAERSADDTLDALDEALAARVIHAVEDVRGPSVGRYRFSHALIRETLHEELSTPRRIRLHRCAAEVLEELHGEEAGRHLAEIAHHRFQAVQSGELELARDALLRAADWAHRHRAWEEEAEHLERALQVVEMDRESEPLEETELRVRAAEAWSLVFAVENARSHSRRAIELARESGATALFARAALAFGGPFPVVEMGRVDRELVDLLVEARVGLDSAKDRESLALLVRVTARLATELYFHEDGEGRAGLVAEAMGLAESLDDPHLEAVALKAQTFDSSVDGFVEAAAAARRMASLARRVEDPDLEGFAQAMHARYDLWSGDGAALRERFRETGRLATVSRTPTSRMIASFHEAMLAALEGRFAEIPGRLREISGLARNANDPNTRQWAGALLYLTGRQLGMLRVTEESVRYVERFPDYPVYRAFLMAIQSAVGELEGARRHLDLLARESFGRIPRDNNFDGTIALTADVCVALADRERAAELYDLAKPFEGRHAQVGPAVVYLGPFDLRLGTLAHLLGEDERAVAHLEAAVEQTAGLGARPFEAECRLALARVLTVEGSAKADRGPGEARAALAIAEPLGMAPITAASRELLSEA